MKKVILVFLLMLSAVLTTFYGCRKDVETNIQGMMLDSLNSDSIRVSQNKMDTTRNVSATDNLIATFSNNIDFNSIRPTTVYIMRDTVKLLCNYVIQKNILTIDPIQDLLTGANLTLFLTDSIQSTNGYRFAGTSINFFTAGVGIDTPPQAAHQLLYVQFNSSVIDETFKDTVTYSFLTYGVDRFGVANLAGNFAGGSQAVINGLSQNTSGNIVEYLNKKGMPLIPPSLTISVWLNIPNLGYRSKTTGLAKGVLGLAGERGYYIEIVGDSTPGSTGGPRTINISTSHSLSPPVGGRSFYTSVDSYTNPNPNIGSKNVNYLLTDGWHQLIVTYDATTSTKILYIDGVDIITWPLTEPTSGKSLGPLALNVQDTVNFGAGFDKQLAAGFYLSRENTVSKYFFYETQPNEFIGLMDDLRIYDIALTPAEVQQLWEMEMPVK